MRWIQMIRSVTCCVGALVVLLSGCAEQTAPALDADPAFARKYPASKQQVEEAPDDSGGGSWAVSCSDDPSLGLPPCTLRHVEGAPAVESYHPTFEITAGLPWQLWVYYEPDPVTGLRNPFVSISIPRDAEFVDESGRPIVKGETVRVTMDIDPEYFHVEFGPHGATFGGKKPAQVQFSLYYADLGGGGDPEALSVFYRSQVGDAWNSLPTEFDNRGWRVQAPIYHFSGYAVAW